MLSPAYPLRTERLQLRPIDPVGDVDAVHAYASLPAVCRYIPWAPRTRSQVATWLAEPALRSTLERPGQALRVGIVERERDRLVGDVMLMWHSAQNRGGEIGYVLNPQFAGHGYATEAVGALLDLAFDPAPDGLGLHRVVARIDARNDGSAAVVRRLGMRQEAHLRENEWFKGEWTDELVFAMLADDWRGRRG